MNRRMVGGAGAIAAAVGLVGLAVIAGGGGDGEPRPLPVLGASAAGDSRTAAMSELAVAPTNYVIPDDLPALDGEAAAWRLDREGGDDLVDALAGAIGLNGEVTATETGWEVVESDRRLVVERQPGLPWYYSPAGPEGVVSSDAVVCDMPECPPDAACAQVCPENIAPVPPEDGGLIDPVKPEEPLPPLEPALDGEERAAAVDLARRVLTAAGVDLGAAEVVETDGAGQVEVAADPEVGGLPTEGVRSYVAVGAGAEIRYAGGYLLVAGEGDVYPLIGTPAAVDRLRSGASGGGTGREPAIQCLDCPEPEPVTVTGVRLGLLFVPAYGADEAWLVPAYLFATAHGDVPVLGIPEDLMEAPPVPEPLPLDGDRPTDDGGGADGGPDGGIDGRKPSGGGADGSGSSGGATEPAPAGGGAPVEEG